MIHGSVQEATNVPYAISKGNTTLKSGTINQSVNPGRWNSLGIFSLPKGNSVKVTLTNRANGVVLSDAIRFVYKKNGGSDQIPPDPPTGLEVDEL